jgi:hypothetical protein
MLAVVVVVRLVVGLVVVEVVLWKGVGVEGPVISRPGIVVVVVGVGVGVDMAVVGVDAGNGGWSDRCGCSSQLVEMAGCLNGLGWETVGDGSGVPNG